ncbi:MULTISPECIES: lipocalin family protein [Sphingobacterium]|uniref:lipocalin family protein n=1 Tax=Sphingobacterium TaxID=28453 RepID=UPI00257F1CB7|nr:MULTISPECIES: lipocalin family protein [Sphingobacterium]
MKKYFFALLIGFSLVGTTISCSKDKEEVVVNPYEAQIAGTWELTHFDGVSVGSISGFKTTRITFASGGKYSGSGQFGNGEGTYKLDGKVVTTFVDGKQYHKYEIISISNGVAELKMSDSSGTVVIKAKKV